MVVRSQGSVFIDDSHYLRDPAGRSTIHKPSANQLGTLPPQSRNALDYDASVKVQMQRWGKVECGCLLNVGCPTAENPDRFGSFEAAPSTGHHGGGGGGGGGSGSGSGSTQAGRAPLSRWWMIYSTCLILAFPTIQLLDRAGHAPTPSALVACELRQKHSRPTPRTTGGEERPHQSGASPGMKMTRRKKEAKPAEQERGGEERRGNRNAPVLTCLPSCGLADS
ncbi:hypothetical protein BN1723_008177, partial [Verticillium longisporum]